MDLFFIISGYLIYGAVMRPRFNYPRFFFRRVKGSIQLSFVSFSYSSLSGCFQATIILSSTERWASKAAYVAENLFLLPGMFQLPSMITVTSES